MLRQFNLLCRELKEKIDFGQLNAMAQQAKEHLGVEQLTVVADGGYYALADLKAAEEQGIEAHVPGQRDTMEKAGLFARREFRYDEARDEYECPGKACLTRHGDSQYRGQVLQAYYNTAACAGCALRSRCTTGQYRKINHGAGHPQVQERIRQRMEQRPEVYAQRNQLNDEIVKVTEATLTYVATDDQRRPRPLPPA